MDTETSIDRVAGMASCGSVSGAGWVAASGLEGVLIFEGCDDRASQEALCGIAESMEGSRGSGRIHTFHDELSRLMGLMRARDYSRVTGLLEHLLRGGVSH